MDASFVPEPQRVVLGGLRSALAAEMAQRQPSPHGEVPSAASPRLECLGQRNSRFLALSFRTRKVAFGSRLCENVGWVKILMF